MLKAEKKFEIRFSEVDSMGIVWHGNYSLYFEDAREAFGKKYNLEYLYMFEQGFYAPLVELHFEYKRPLRYRDLCRIEISYRNVDTAKLIFDYRIYDADNELVATGYSVQVFLDMQYNLMWELPEFMKRWKEKYLSMGFENSI
ncbi:MAG: acyl-CoA thioesterase [Prevotellaceae bacterium]|jgi:acyl-CoA thioester hydrolase|nr:acyl-CoA thioesterase [Prevotellaceae bacterium]